MVVRAGREFLAIPGPTTMPDEVLRAMHRPALFPAPAFALRLALGAEMADSLLLASERVEPARLAGAGFTFRHPDLRPALQAVLGPH